MGRDERGRSRGHAADPDLCDGGAEVSGKGPFIGSSEGLTLGSITKNLKGYTAREANRLLGRTGQPFWQDESFDHWSRDRAEFVRIVAYIENNPVKAGLVKRPEEWIWSSAAERKRRGWDDFRALT